MVILFNLEQTPRPSTSSESRKKLDEEVGRAKVFRRFIIELKNRGVTEDLLDEKR